MEYMEEALEEAKKAFAMGEVPVGAVLVAGEKIIARGHNQVECLQDATAHAEILCLKEASRAKQDWRLTETILYVTLEPCSMCLGAAILSRVKKIIWGCSDPRHGALGGWINLAEKEHPIHKIESEGYVMEAESRLLLQTFFQEVRAWKKSLKNSSKGKEKNCCASQTNLCQEL